MSEELDFTPDLYTLVDEEGKEQSFELLDVAEIDDEKYFALVPYFENADEVLDDNGELVILKAQIDGDEELLASIDDEDEFNKVGEFFLQRLNEMFEEHEHDCECGHNHDDDHECKCDHKH